VLKLNEMQNFNLIFHNKIQKPKTTQQMNRKKLYAAIPLLFLLSTINLVNIVAQQSNEEKTAQYLEKIKQSNNNAGLTQFCTLMPKGGDLHHHYSGAIYAETYLDWAERKGLLINTQTFTLEKAESTDNKSISIDSLKKNSDLYRNVLNVWSDMDFYNHYHQQNQPDQHFFNTFSYFGSISNAYYRNGLLEIKNRAKKENVLYIETMLMSPAVQFNSNPNVVASLLVIEQKKDSIALIRLLDSLSKAVSKSTDYNKFINNYLDSLRSYHKSIDDEQFTMRFQTYISRNVTPDAAFAKLYGCFDAVTRDNSSLLVGVNIVSPENGIISMRDYWLHMQMFAYLKRHFPKVKTSMHAGELCMGLVKPEDLTYHIHDAVYIANANRIGHGVDIPYEMNSVTLLHYMKQKKIAIEVNLTSNEFILGIKGNDHPVSLYYSAGVPIIISTDDAGVSRNNLTTEYVKLLSRYNFAYKDVKTFVYNSINYSFLKQTEKDKLKQQLDTRFNWFEDLIAKMSAN
jgi:adenosine deaminase